MVYWRVTLFVKDGSQLERIPGKRFDSRDEMRQFANNRWASSHVRRIIVTQHSNGKTKTLVDKSK